MKFQTVGESGKPVMIMLPGSFCPGASLAYLYEKLQADHCILLPEYNGHYAGSTFTTRQNEAAEVTAYLQAHDIHTVQLLYGQSMGAEVGIELYKQLLDQGVTVEHCLFDGAPCVSLPVWYKKFMCAIFKKVLGKVKGKSVDEALNTKLFKKLAHGDPEAMRPTVKAFVATTPFLTDESIRNETECCYTFDFPAFDEPSQRKMHFFYATAEKAYRTCYKGVKRAYPHAAYTVVDGYGHLTYSIKCTDKYIAMMRKICEE